MLVAEPRGDAGSIAATRLRRGGRTPGIVFSGPGGEQQLLALDSKELGRLVTKLGRTAWACSVFNLEIQRPEGGSDTVRALVRGRLPCRSGWLVVVVLLLPPSVKPAVSRGCPLF